MPQMISRSKERTEGARNQSESSIVAVTAWVTIRLLSLCLHKLYSVTIENPSENAIRFQRRKRYCGDWTGIGSRCQSPISIPVTVGTTCRWFPVSQWIPNLIPKRTAYQRLATKLSHRRHSQRRELELIVRNWEVWILYGLSVAGHHPFHVLCPATGCPDIAAGTYKHSADLHRHHWGNGNSL